MSECPRWYDARDASICYENDPCLVDGVVYTDGVTYAHDGEGDGSTMMIAGYCSIDIEPVPTTTPPAAFAPARSLPATGAGVDVMVSAAVAMCAAAAVMRRLAHR